MHVVKFNNVVCGAVGLQAPIPADADARVVQVVNVVMRNTVAATLGDPDADAAGINLPTVKDVIVIDPCAACLGNVIFGRPLLSNADPPGAEIKQSIVLDAAILAAAPEPYAIGANVSNFTCFNDAIQRPVRGNRCRDFHRGLRTTVAFGIEHPIGVMESQSPYCNVPDALASLRLAGKADEIGQNGSEDLCLTQTFPGHRPVGEFTGLAVEVPFPWRIKQLSGILDEITLMVFPVTQTPPLL